MNTPNAERRFDSDEKLKLPGSFIWRRLHSLLGLWLVIYLCEHLIVNSQAALFFNDSGNSFISAVNHLESLPYLKVIELLFLGLPFTLHGIWGIYYIWTSKPNSYKSHGSQPQLPQYKRNRAYTWERITAWLLVPAILLHVFHMRFWSYPIEAEQSDQKHYFVKVSEDRGLPLVADKLNSTLFSADEIQEKKYQLKQEESTPSAIEEAHFQNEIENQKQWLEAAQKRQLKQGELLAVSPTPGAAFFLLVRETFKSPSMVILYSLFVLAAAYHAFQGLWTFMITWGITLTRRSQKKMRTLSNLLMGIVMVLGLMAAWGTYWTIQFQQ